MSDHFEHARIAILRLLEDAPGYTSNHSLITDVLRGYGLGLSRDQVAGQLSWLAEQGLVSLEHKGQLILAKATMRGLEVARGEARHPGVKRPSVLE